MSHGKHNTGWDRRRAEYKRATPRWAEVEKIKAIYDEASSQRDSGRDVCVDHVVPLNHWYVCGLHCEENLQIITHKDNTLKSNHWWPDMWHEQLALDLPVFLWADPQLEFNF